MIGVLAVVYALVVAGIAGFGLWAAHTATLAATRTQATAIATFSGIYTARMYDLLDRVVLDIDEDLDEPTGAGGWPARLAQDARTTSLNDYYVMAGPDGTVVASSEPFPGGAMSPVIMQAHADGADRHIGQVMRSRMSDAVIYPLSRVVRAPDGTIERYIGGAMRPMGIRPVGERGEADPQVSIWTTDGRFVAATFVDFDHEGRARAPSPPPRLGALLPGEIHEQDGRMWAQSNIEGWPLIAVVEFDREGVLAGWRQSAWTAVIVVAMLLAVGIGLAGAAMFLVVRQQRAAAELQAQKVAAERAAEERSAMMKEAHHRVRNSLMLASSLVQMQGRDAPPDVAEAMARLQGRLSSIGLVHQALYADERDGDVDLATYLKTLSHELWSALGLNERGVALRLDLTPALIAAERATPVGLIVSEAVTNSVKYAFEGRAGEITIACGPHGADEILVCVRDDGPGVSTETSTSSTGVGSGLIQALARQIGGRASMLSDGGAEMRLIFPVGGPQATARDG